MISDRPNSIDTVEINKFEFSNNAVFITEVIFSNGVYIKNLATLEFTDKQNELNFFDALSLKFFEIPLERY